MSKRSVRRDRTPLEMGILVVSILAVATIIVGLILAGASGGDGPPDLRVSVEENTSVRSGGVVYTVTVRNVGGDTATNVVIEVSVGDQVREVDLVSIAKGDEEVAAVVFPSGTSGEARTAVLSYHRTTRD
jgi:uncharacterized protein (TIGR02588 family)